MLETRCATAALARNSSALNLSKQPRRTTASDGDGDATGWLLEKILSEVFEAASDPRALGEVAVDPRALLESSCPPEGCTKAKNSKDMTAQAALAITHAVSARQMRNL